MESFKTNNDVKVEKSSKTEVSTTSGKQPKCRECNTPAIISQLQVNNVGRFSDFFCRTCKSLNRIQHPKTLKQLAWNVLNAPPSYEIDPLYQKVFYEQMAAHPIGYYVTFNTRSYRGHNDTVMFNLKPTDYSCDVREFVTKLMNMLDDIDEQEDADELEVELITIPVPYNLFPIIARCFHYGSGFDGLALMLLKLCGDVESNPGPTNFIELFNNITRPDCRRKIVHEHQKQEDGVPFWIIFLELPDLKIQSKKAIALTKKSALQICYEDLINQIKNLPELARHESEGAEGIESTDFDKSLHTNLAITTDPSIGTPTQTEVSREKIATTEAVGEYGNLTEQWYLIDDFQWTPADSGIIREYILPRMILANNVACASPPLIPFNINYAMRGDIEVRIETKAQMFLTGMLQIGSYYEFDADKYANYRRNKYSLSQTNHVVVNAGGSNEAILKIPYVNRQQFLQTKTDGTLFNTNSVLNMCNVIINILNPLQVGTGSSNVSVAIFVRFLNAKFQGKRDGSIGAFPSPTVLSTGDRARHESGILEIGAGMALSHITNMLNQRNADRNRDNPPDVRATNMLVPYAAQTWSNGTNVSEPVRTLRLDPLGQTNHYMGAGDEYTHMSHVAKTFGLIKQITWNETQGVGTTLFKMPCSPILPQSFYDPINVGTNVAYAVPPVGVVASMYNLFRGPLKFKLQIVANKFYTGGLIMGYIPGVHPEQIISNNIARNSAFTTYSLDADNLSITYETPYINLAEWYTTPLRKPISTGYNRTPGLFYINILQRLQKPDNVAAQITINLYVCGGEGFECANLTQPGLVLPYEARIIPNPSLILTPFESNTSLYFGTALEFFGGAYLVARFGVLFGEYLTYTTTQPGTAFLAQTDFAVQITTDPSILISNFVVLLSGSRFIIAPYRLGMQLELQEALLTYTDTDANRDALEPFLFALPEGPFVPTVPTFTITWRQSDGVDVARHESERNLQPNPVTSVQGFPTSQWGNTCFGEDFSDIKDLLRRPVRLEDALYSDTTSVAFPRATFEFKVKPTTSSLNLSDMFDIYNRNDHSKIILSGFRYYRGGMRYRIVAPALPGAHIWAQYDASNKISTDFVQFPNGSAPIPILQHSNPIDILSLSVNQILQIEVPWYQPNELNLLQEIDYSTLDLDQRLGADMGTIRVGFSTNASTTIPGSYVINVFQKVADDFSPYVFQGFTGMNFLLELNDVTPFVARHEGGFVDNIIKENILNPIKKDVRMEVDGVLGTVRAALDVLLSQIKSTSMKVLDFSKNIVITDFLSQLGHCLMNPNLKTFAWATVSFLAKIGIVSLNVISKAVELFTSMVSSFFPSLFTQQEQNNVGTERANHEGENDNCATWWSLIMTSLFQAFQVTKIPTLNAKNIASHFKDQFTLKNIREFSMTANSLTTFFTLQLENIKEIIRHCCFWRRFRSDDSEALQVYNSEFITSWCKEVNILTSPGQDTSVLVNPDLMDRTYCAYLIGQLLTTNVINKTKDSKINHSVLMQYVTRITKLHENCVSVGKFSNVRYETFCMWIYGDAGVGKSYVTEELTTELLLSANIKFGSDKTLVLNPTSKYWDRCDKQPVVLVDDFLAVTTEEALNNQLSILFNIFTPVPLNPTMADIADKKKLYSPRICVMNSNFDYPQPNGIPKLEALWRRRHALIKLEMDGAVCGDIKGVEDPKFNPEWTKNYNHLNFSFAKDVRDARLGYGAPMKYEAFLIEIKKRFNEFNIKALASYKHRMTQFYRASGQLFSSSLEEIQKECNIPDVKEGDFDAIVKGLLLKIDTDIYHKNFKSLSPSDGWLALQSSFYEKYDVVKDQLLDKGRKLRKNLSFAYEAYYGRNRPSLEFKIPLLQHSDDTPIYLDSKGNVVAGKVNEGASTSKARHEGSESLEALTDNQTVFTQSDFKMSTDTLSIDIFKCKVVSWIKEHNLRLIDAKACPPAALVAEVRHAVEDELRLYDGFNLDEILISVENNICGIFNTRLSHICPHFELSEHYYYDAEEDKFYDEVADEYITTKVCKGLCLMNCEPLLNVIRSRLLDNDKCIPLPMLWREYNSKYPVINDINKFVDESVVECTSYMGMLKIFLFDHWKLVVTVVAATAGIIYWYYTRDRKDKAENQSNLYDKLKISTKNRQAMKAVKLYNKAPVMVSTATQVANHESDYGQFETLKSLIKRNTYFIEIHGMLNDKTNVRTYRLLALGDREFLIVSHFINEIVYWTQHHKWDIYIRCGHGANTRLIKCGEDFKISFSNQNKILQTSASQSLSVMTFPECIPQSRSLIKHFQTESLAERLSSNGCMIRNKIIGNNFETDLICMSYLSNNRKVEIRDDGLNAAQELNSSYKYQGFKGYGNCGSVLVNLDSGKIVGIHVAGSDSFGFACPVFVESFIDIPIKEVIIPQLEEIELTDKAIEATIFPIGKVESKYAHNESGKTKIIKSVIHGEFPVRTQPAPLTPFDERLPEGSSPLYDGCAKHGQPPIDMENKLLDIAVEHFEMKLISKCKPLRSVGELTEKEAIIGIPELGFNSIPMNTSEGFPLSSMRPLGCKGKGWLTNIVDADTWEEKTYTLNDVLRKTLYVKNELRKRGIKPFTMFIDCLKDETLPKEKCTIKGKTRIFSISPYDFTIQCRQLFGDFLMAHQKSRLDIEHAIGINVYSYEWTDLANRLQQHGSGKNIVAGDFSNFGPGAMSKIALRCLGIIINWYKHFYCQQENKECFEDCSPEAIEHITKMEIMKQELVDAPHLCHRLVYMTACGIISGSPLTTPLNSMINCLEMRCAWLDITMTGMYEFDQNVFLVTYGDDNIMNVSSRYIDIYNVETIRKFFAKYNIKYTSVDKTDNIIPFCSLLETSFLKNEFIPNLELAGHYLPGLDKISIEGQMNWVNNEGDIQENTIINCESALRLAYGHGRTYYDKLYKQIQLAWSKQGHHFTFKTYDDICTDVLESYYG